MNTAELDRQLNNLGSLMDTALTEGRVDEFRKLEAEWDRVEAQREEATRYTEETKRGLATPSGKSLATQLQDVEAQIQAHTATTVDERGISSRELEERRGRLERAVRFAGYEDLGTVIEDKQVEYEEAMERANQLPKDSVRRKRATAQAEAVMFSVVEMKTEAKRRGSTTEASRIRERMIADRVDKALAQSWQREISGEMAKLENLARSGQADVGDLEILVSLRKNKTVVPDKYRERKGAEVRSKIEAELRESLPRTFSA
jgi:hypothetical protein